MSKKELKGTKPATKNLPADKPGPGRGGARKGAGRKKLFETQQINFDCPEALVNGMEVAKIENRTAYINGLIAADLKSRRLPAPHRNKIEAVSETLNKQDDNQ